ncbi:urea transporter [Duganella sp. BJB1802]|uniref:urea transporter n=1 Tax=Duganella sp. BJB1802 TaxID=2744575 RepID=UPI0015946559|nr:urea transporter [Duganella sp. BJB1802]
MILSSASRVAVPVVLQRQLTAVGQIYLQDSPMFGAVLLLCLFLSGPPLALGCVLGVACASLAAWAFNLEEERRHNGLYGFNGALAGVGLCAIYQLDGPLLLMVAGAGALTAALTYATERARIPPLTLPFVVVMWLAGAVAHSIGLQESVPAPGGCGTTVASYLFCSMGQAAFIGGAPLGMLLWAALARRHWHQAMWGLSGALFSWLAITLANQLWPGAGIEIQSIGAGINSTLVMLAVGARECRWPSRLACAALSIMLSVGLGATGIHCFTLPFILAIWLIRRR